MMKEGGLLEISLEGTAKPNNEILSRFRGLMTFRQELISHPERLTLRKYFERQGRLTPLLFAAWSVHLEYVQVLVSLGGACVCCSN